MYLPDEIQNARVLITVKTYPLPSSKYRELVCTAGLLNGEKWVRIYPIAFRFLSNNKQYPKYGWIELNLVRNKKDFRPETYRPKSGIDENIRLIKKLTTNNNWSARKIYVLKEVFTSMNELIKLAKSEQKKSLATLKPIEIIDFSWKKTESTWKDIWLAQSKQGNIFELDKEKKLDDKSIVKKLPYKYYYKWLPKESRSNILTKE